MIKQKYLRWVHIGLMRLASLIRYVHRLKYWELFSITIYDLEQGQISILFSSPYKKCWICENGEGLHWQEKLKSSLIPKCLGDIDFCYGWFGSGNKRIYHFIWKGTDQIKRCALINDIDDGRLKMLDIKSMILAKRVLILKRYVDNKYESSWKGY